MKQTESGNSPSLAFSCVKNTAAAVGIAYIVSFILFLAVAMVAAMSKMSDMGIRGSVLGITAVAAAVSGYVAGRAAGQKGWIFGGIAGLVYLVILYVISALAFDGPSFSVSALTMLAICVAAGMLGGIMGVNKKSGYRRG